LFPSPPKAEKKGGANQTTYLKKLKMFARFRNLFAKSKGDEEVEQEVTPGLEVPSIVVDEPPNEVEPPVEESENKFPNGDQNLTNTSAPLASEEEDLAGNPHEILSDSSSDLSRLLEAIDEASKLPEVSSEDTQGEDEDYEDDDDDETASTSSVKTKIAKASIERDIIPEETEEEEEDEVDSGPPLKSLDKIKALIRNDSETYPHSDYTDNETPSHSRTASVDSGAPDNPRLSGDFSVVADELPLDSSPSPLHDSGRTSSAGSEVPAESPPATVQVVPTGSNELACAAISHKLGAIAEVAESLDAVIRDVQQQEGAASNGITNGNAGHGIKKLGSIEVSLKLSYLLSSPRKKPITLCHYYILIIFLLGLAFPLHRGRILRHSLRGQLHAQLALLLLPNGLGTH